MKGTWLNIYKRKIINHSNISENDSEEMWGRNPTYRARWLILHLIAEVVIRPDLTQLNAREIIRSPA